MNHSTSVPLIFLQASTTATLDVEVRLHSYSNPDSEDCLGLSCDFGGNCDNIFFFCVGALTSQDICLSSVIHSNDIADDSFNFGISELIELGISNPLRFYEISTSVSRQTIGICVNVDMLTRASGWILML